VIKSSALALESKVAQRSKFVVEYFVFEVSE
jgi:hypothetical protein